MQKINGNKNKIIELLKRGASLVLTCATIGSFTGCSSELETGDVSNITASTFTTIEGDNQQSYDSDYPIVSQEMADEYLTNDLSFSDVVEKVSDSTYADEYLKANGFDELVSDYIGFRDNGDLEGVNQTLYQLGLIVLKGSVIDTILREDEEFVQKYDIAMDDMDISITRATEDFFGADVNVGDKIESAVNGQFSVVFTLGDQAVNMVDNILKCQDGGVSSLDEAKDIYSDYKSFMLTSGQFWSDGSIKDGLDLDGVVSDNIQFSYDEGKVMMLK